MSSDVTVHGKMILSGEYAVVFGYQGIAFPSPRHFLTIRYEEGGSALALHSAEKHPKWESYVRKIIALCEEMAGRKFFGLLSITGDLPAGKGMGSSTALVIGICRCFLGPDCETIARKIEDLVNIDHSGLDFSVIWNGSPVIFEKGKPAKPCPLSPDLFEHARLIDTGTPEESTQELVAWIKDKFESPVSKDHTTTVHAIETIGKCTQRILKGEKIKHVIKDHHRAQIALGVVPEEVQKIIAEIEKKGGCAKVIGAGARTGGGGMVLAFG